MSEERNQSRRNILKKLGVAGVGLTGSTTLLSQTDTARAASCNTYSDSKKKTETYYGYKDGTDQYVEKEFVQVTNVTVDGPYEQQNSVRHKYFIPVQTMATTYVKGNPDNGQIDIQDQNIEVQYPTKDESGGSEWDFPSQYSEPARISRFDSQSSDDYDLQDLSADVAYETMVTTKDVFAETVGTGYSVAVDAVDYAKKISGLYSKYQKATNSHRTKGRNFTFDGPDARTTAHTFMMFEVSDIPDNVSLDHQINVECQTGDAGDMGSLTFDFQVDGVGQC